MSNGNGHHWSKFCWRDWSADKALHPCSLGAKGFWIEMLCIMHEGTPVGHLTLGGKPATIRQMAANAYCTEKEAKKYLAELEEAGVFSRTDDGTIYCRRMVKDAEASEAGKVWGKTGGNPQLRTKAQIERPRPNGGLTPPLNPQAYRPPNPPPLTLGLSGGLSLEPESQVEPEREERKEVLKKPSFSGTAARAERLPDALEAALSEAGVTPPEPKPVGAEVVQMAVRRTKKALEMRIPYGEVRSVEAQLDALKAQPAVVGSDASMGLRWRPAEPIRTPAQQYAELTGCTLAEAKARFSAMADA